MTVDERQQKQRIMAAMVMEVARWWLSTGIQQQKVMAIGMPTEIAQALGILPKDAHAEMAKITPQSAQKLMNDVARLAPLVREEMRERAEMLGGSVDNDPLDAFMPIASAIMDLLVPDSERIDALLNNL